MQDTKNRWRHTMLQRKLKKIEILDKKGNEKNNQDYAEALCGGGHSGGNHSDMDLIRQNENSIRRLTPVECCRLQGFPDDWNEKGIIDGEIVEISDTQRYKQCGNAVTVDVVQAVAERILCQENQAEKH